MKRSTFAILAALLSGCGLASTMPRRVTVTSAAIAGLTCTEWRAYDVFDPGASWVTCVDSTGDIITPYESPRANFLGELFSGFGIAR